MSKELHSGVIQQKVVEFLSDKAGYCFTIEEIEREIGIAVDEVVQAYLKQNPALEFKETGSEKISFWLKPPFANLESKQDLLDLLEENMDGVSEREVKQSYRNAEHDIQELEAEQQIFIMPCTNKNDRTLFKDPTPPMTCPDPAVCTMWLAVALPERDAMVRELESARLKPATRIVKQVQLEPDVADHKSKRSKTRLNMTNVHLADAQEHIAQSKASKRKR